MGQLWGRLIVYPRWRSQKHADDWWATLERHAFPEVGDLPVDRIDRFAVLNVLTPIWTKTPETARRVPQRIRAVMRWARPSLAQGLPLQVDRESMRDSHRHLTQPEHRHSYFPMLAALRSNP